MSTTLNTIEYHYLIRERANNQEKKLTFSIFELCMLFLNEFL